MQQLTKAMARMKFEHWIKDENGVAAKIVAECKMNSCHVYSVG